MSISADVLTSYKKIDEAAADALLAKEIAANNKKIVVLDDDPTGVQTVHDIHVYTNWDHDSIKAGFEEENNLFYVMTNSRGFIAVACVIFGRAHPVKAFLAALLFGFIDALGMRLQSFQISSALTSMLPYIGTVVMMVLLVLRENAKKKKLAK